MSGTDRIGILIYGYGLGNSPSLINTGKALAAAGFSVDYFTYRTFIGGFEFVNPNISVYRLEELNQTDESRETTGFANFLLEQLPFQFAKVIRLMRARLTRCEEQLFPAFAHKERLFEVEKAFLDEINQCVKRAEGIIDRQRYKYFIGVEPGGLMTAAIIGQKLDVPVIYYNLELHLFSEMKTALDLDKVLKKYENKYHPTAVFTITLDDERAELLAEDNNISRSTMLTVPVCADGPKFEKKSDYLRNKYNLTNATRIILYAGFICEWAMCEELAVAAESWPDDTVLILHSHGYNDEAYLQKLKKYEGEKVKISLDAVPYDELPSFLSSADIGIAFYRDIGKNFTLVSSASGKLSHYLKSGLPVITNDYPGMKSVIERYQCGVCVDSPRRIGEAMKVISDNYRLMHENAYRCYEDNYMFSKQFVKVLERITGL